MAREYPPDMAPEDMPRYKEDCRAQACQMIMRHAEEQGLELKEIEEKISIVGAKLDNLKQARDVLVNALRGTEKVRAEISGEPDPYEDRPRAYPEGV